MKQELNTRLFRKLKISTGQTFDAVTDAIFGNEAGKETHGVSVRVQTCPIGQVHQGQIITLVFGEVRMNRHLLDGNTFAGSQLGCPVRRRLAEIDE